MILRVGIKEILILELNNLSKIKHRIQFDEEPIQDSMGIYSGNEELYLVFKSNNAAIYSLSNYKKLREINATKINGILTED